MTRNPIQFDPRGNKRYFVWFSFLGVRYMKYFDTPEDAMDSIRSNLGKVPDAQNCDIESFANEWIRDAHSVAKSFFAELKAQADRDAAGPPSIGGWLLLVAIGVAVSPFLNLKHCIELFGSLVVVDWSILQRQGPVAVFSVLFEVFFQLYMLIASVIIAVNFFSKRRRLPRFLIMYVLSLFVFGILGAAINWSVPSVTDDVLIQSAAFVVYVFLLGLIWIPYFVLSKRVKRTFVI